MCTKPDRLSVSQAMKWLSFMDESIGNSKVTQPSDL